MANRSANNNADKSANNSTNKSADKSTNTGNAHRPLALTSPKQRQGSYFEQQACEFLQAQGLLLIAKNWQQPKVGELDLIMIEPGSAWSTLVFIEVRQRLRSSFGDAALSVTAGKQRKIIKTAKYFLQQHPKYRNYDCRFDVIAYDVARLAKNINNGKDHDRQNDSSNNSNNNVSNESASSKGDSLSTIAATKQQNHLTVNSLIKHPLVAEHLIAKPLTEGQLLEDGSTNSQPEWLIGAFMAKAW